MQLRWRKERRPAGARRGPPKNPSWQKAKPATTRKSSPPSLTSEPTAIILACRVLGAPPKMKPPQRVSQGGYQSLDSLRDDDCPQRKRADCECYGDQRCCRIDALPHNRGCDCCRVLLLTGEKGNSDVVAIGLVSLWLR